MRAHVHLASFLLLASLPAFAQSEPLASSEIPNITQPTTDSKPVPKQPTPTVFQADEGDRWMLLGKKPLIFKVDPVTAGSDTLMVGTEEMPPGNRIPTTSISTKMKSYSSTRVRCASRWLDVNTTQKREPRFSFRTGTG